WQQETVPADVLQAKVKVEGLRIDYLAPLSPIEDGIGEVDFNLDGLKGRLVSGQIMKDTALTDGHVEISFRGHDHATSFTIGGHIASTLPEVAKVLSTEPIALPKELNLKEDSVAGKADG